MNDYEDVLNYFFIKFFKSHVNLKIIVVNPEPVAEHKYNLATIYQTPQTTKPQKKCAGNVKQVVIWVRSPRSSCQTLACRMCLLRSIMFKPKHNTLTSNKTSFSAHCITDEWMGKQICASCWCNYHTRTRYGCCKRGRNFCRTLYYLMEDLNNYRKSHTLTRRAKDLLLQSIESNTLKWASPNSTEFLLSVMSMPSCPAARSGMC